jgi:hypothetical protein
VTTRPRWDFPYAPVPTAAGDDDGGAVDVVVAMSARVDAFAIAEAIGEVVGDLDVEPLIERAPLFWWRVRSDAHGTRAAIAAALRARRLPVRYVASATRTSTRLGPPLSFDGAAAADGEGWRARRAPVTAEDPPTEGRWFLRDRDGGITVDRTLGTGVGTRLAVIDDDGAEAEHLGLDAEIPVGVDAVPRATSHGGLMVAWASGTSGARAFHGVAPGASRRLYVIPKAGLDVVSIALAIARAALDGADVVVCATYAEGSTSPMLDDALAVAHALGRRGRGAAIVFATGREASSASGWVHSSWSLALGDPASDARIFCVGPSARGEGWFLWRDRKGRLRPFANRGPAVRWLAPGDDVQYPFGDRDRLFHAESSGASAIAAGVLLLVFAANPALHVTELDALVTAACDPVPPASDPARGALADPADLLPLSVDRDGHNAKHGYGRLHARRAVLSATDPIAHALVAIGDDDAARRWVLEHRTSRRPFSPRLGRFLVRAMVRDASLRHAATAIARHARLVARDPRRARAHADGAVARQLLRFIRAGLALRPPGPFAVELRSLASVMDLTDPREIDRSFHAVLETLWPPPPAKVAVDEAPPLGPGGVRL